MRTEKLLFSSLHLMRKLIPGDVLSDQYDINTRENPALPLGPSKLASALPSAVVYEPPIIYAKGRIFSSFTVSSGLLY
jgi:hypothetical protein